MPANSRRPLKVTCIAKSWPESGCMQKKLLKLLAFAYIDAVQNVGEAELF